METVVHVMYVLWNDFVSYTLTLSLKMRSLRAWVIKWQYNEGPVMLHLL